jgi:hypothetical protein
MEKRKAEAKADPCVRETGLAALPNGGLGSG